MMTHIPKVLIDDVPSWDWRVRNVKDIPYLSEAFKDSSLSNNSWLMVYFKMCFFLDGLLFLPMYLMYIFM